MKRTVCFLSFFLFVLANTCFASIQLPIIDNVDAQIYIETFNEKNTKLKFQEVTHDNHPRFGETYDCRFSLPPLRYRLFTPSHQHASFL